MHVRDTEAALYELAESQDGFFSAAQATKRGILRPGLTKALHRGAIERRSRGVYRLTRFPIMSPNSHLWEAVLWPQAKTHQFATLSHYTALRLHNLSDVNPSQTHITIPIKMRITRDRPTTLVLHRANIEPDEITHVDGLPVTAIQRTLLDIALLDDIAVLADAVRDARARNITIPYEVLRRV